VQAWWDPQRQERLVRVPPRHNPAKWIRYQVLEAILHEAGMRLGLHHQKMGQMKCGKPSFGATQQTAVETPQRMAKGWTFPLPVKALQVLVLLVKDPLQSGNRGGEALQFSG